MTPDARSVAAAAIAESAQRFPDLGPSVLRVSGLEPRDAALARAIHRTTLQRWLTLERVLNRYLNRPLRRSDPALQGVLLTAAAQVLFFDRLPDYAVVDAAVELAKRDAGKKLGGVANAVTRKVAALVAERGEGEWEPAEDVLPIADGWVRLSESVLPTPRDWPSHLTYATSVPRGLVDRWLNHFGHERAGALCLDTLRDPAIAPAGPGSEAIDFDPADHRALTDWLAGDATRRVQDPAARRAIQSAKHTEPERVLDLCAGRGTKTRQLVEVFPEARIDTWDPHPERHADLQALAAHLPTVRVLNDARDATGGYDLVLLDVPCSNTGVLARRPEARYRFSPGKLNEVVALQREIIQQACPLVEPGGHLLYTTCSIEPEENFEQARFAAACSEGEIVAESQTLPGEPDAEGVSREHDGAYHGLIRVAGANR